MVLPNILGNFTNLLYGFIPLIGRLLRKRSVLATILGCSLLYCVITLSLRHYYYSQSSSASSSSQLIHILHPTPVHDEDDLIMNNNNDDDEKLDQSDFQSQFAFLKRQHKLKEILGDSQEPNSNLLNNNNNNNNKNEDHQHSQQSNHLQHLHTKNDNINNNNNARWNAMLTAEEQENGTGIKCRNSVQGRSLIADDRGYVCPRRLVGINGCCDETKRDETQLYTCDTCQESSGCCAIYEHCISCCMSPNHRDLLNQMVSQVRQHPVLKIFLASITDNFELCLTKCRTSSASVLHENTYREPVHKYCFTIQESSSFIV